MPRQCNYEIRGIKFLERRRVESVRSRFWNAPKIWGILPPNEIKIRTLSKFLKQK